MKVTIIAGAPGQDVRFLKDNVDRNSFIIAADSGYLNCVSAGIVPDLIIGDFDSSKRPETSAAIMQFPSVKNDTDTFCCIKEAVKRGADAVEIFCALGGRADHTLSNIVNLEYCLRNNIPASIISEKSVLSLHKTAFSLEKSNFKFFSLFALGGPVQGLCIRGAAYELDHFTLSPFDSIGQSNEVKNSTVNIDFVSGVLLLVLSND